MLSKDLLLSMNVLSTVVDPGSRLFVTHSGLSCP